jgi:hypothetical protein
MVPITFVTEFAFIHVETKFFCLRGICIAGYELDLGFLVDKASYQPGAGDPVYENVLPGHPHPAFKCFRIPLARCERPRRAFGP